MTNSPTSTSARPPAPWRSTWTDLAYAGPHLWLASHCLGLLFPNVLLGRWYTRALDVTLGLALVALAIAVLRAPRVLRWLEPDGRRQLIRGAVGFCWLLIPFVLLFAHIHLGTPLRYPSQCDYWSALAPERCEGRDFSMLQARYRYQRVQGRVAAPACRRLAGLEHASDPIPVRTDERRGPHCPIDSAEGWVADACASYGLPAGWSCYVCTRTSRGGESYARLQAYDPACRIGAGYETTNVPLESVFSKLDALSAVGKGPL